MATRRPFGSVLRRRRQGREPNGAPKQGYHPGYYVRTRINGREVTRYGGPDRRTALDSLERQHRDEDRLALLGEHPDSRVRFEGFAKDYLAYSERAHTKATAYARHHDDLRPSGDAGTRCTTTKLSWGPALATCRAKCRVDAPTARRECAQVELRTCECRWSSSRSNVEPLPRRTMPGPRAIPPGESAK